jgi:hypothetical protein
MSVYRTNVLEWTASIMFVGLTVVTMIVGLGI